MKVRSITVVRKKQSRGFTILELIAFIVILGIVAGGLLIGMNQAQHNSDIPRYITQASFLANARMQIILMNRVINGYSSLNDPCTALPAPAICAPLSTYASANNFNVSTNISSVGGNPKTITINVTGSGNASIQANVYNYANN